MSLAHPSLYALNPLPSLPAGYAARTLWPTLGRDRAVTLLLDAIACGELEELTPERISVASMAAYAWARGDHKLGADLATLCRWMASTVYQERAV